MKRFLSLLLCCLALASCNREECREYENLTLDSALLGTGVRYSLVLPSDYHSTRDSYPVLCLFHCIGGDCTTGIEYCNITHVLDSLVACGAVDPMIVVMPDIKMSYCADAFDGSAPYESMLTGELLPLIEKNYRTDGKHFSLGFSMGGFAAMMVALRNPSLFCGYAAMSPSVRTDAQYCSEMPQDGWESQWGSKFGGLGQSGEGRITDWYKACCPLHLLSDLPYEQLASQKHFIVSGDDESGTLAESNPLLHDILERRGIPHYWKLGRGGHDFAFWRSELPDALRFADAAFEGRGFFRDDAGAAESSPSTSVTETPCPKPLDAGGSRLYMPQFGYGTTRKVPCIYVFGADEKQEAHIMQQYLSARSCGAAFPLALCFVGPDYEEGFYAASTSAAASGLRDSWRMRGAVCLDPYDTRIRELSANGKLFRKAVFAGPDDDIDALFPEWLRRIDYKIHD